MEAEYTPTQLNRIKMLENRQYVNANIYQLMEEYPDQWIVVLDKKVVVSGATMNDVMGAMEGREEEAILLKVPIGEIVQII